MTYPPQGPNIHHERKKGKERRKKGEERRGKKGEARS